MLLSLVYGYLVSIQFHHSVGKHLQPIFVHYCLRFNSLVKSGFNNAKFSVVYQNVYRPYMRVKGVVSQRL